MNDDWPPKLEEVFPLPPEIPSDYDLIFDADISAFDDATIECSPRWKYTITDLETYARVVGL